MSNIRTNNLSPFSTDQVTVNGLGVYLPKLTTAQRNAVIGPQDGLVIYNTDTHQFEHWNSSTAAWESVDGIESLNGLLAKNQLLAVGTSGLSPNWVSSGTTHTLNIPLAQSDDVTAGLLSYNDWILFAETATMGVIEGGGLHSPVGLTLRLDTGFGYLEQEPEIFFRFEWPTQTLTVPANQASYIYIDVSGGIVYSPIYPDTHLVILLGRVVTDGTSIIFIDNAPLDAEHATNRFEDFHREALGAIYASGSLVAEVGSRALQVTPGTYFLSATKFSPSGANPITWKAFRQNGSGGYTYASQNTVDNANWDDGSGSLIPLTSGYYAKHSLYLVGDGAEETYMLVYSQQEYSALTLAQQGDIPIPPAYFIDGVVLLAAIIVQQGATNLEQIDDERPRVGFKPSAVSATTFHSGLLGLAVGDDHPQYWRNDGTHVATGNFNLGGHNIINLGTANGVVVEAHGARHDPGGPDAIGTAAPITLLPDQANTEGVATTVARSDHEHSVPTAAAVGLNANSTNTRGVSNNFSRADHTHAVASGAPSTQNPDQVNTTGTSTNFARADHIHNIPTAAPSADLTAITTNSQGVSASFSRADHGHAIDTGVVSTQNADQVNSAGTSANLTRADHVHNIPTAAPITTLSPATTNAQGAALTFAKSDHAHAVATALVADITNVQAGVVASAGVANTFARGDHKHNISTAAVITQTPNQANAEGTSTSVARADHAHNIPTAAPANQTIAAAASDGSAATFSRADHLHTFSTAAPATQNPDQANAVGTSTSFARADHIHNIPTAAATGLNAGSTNTQGTSTSFARADHTHAIASGTPSTQTPDQANATGTSTNFARADHVHNIPTAAATSISTSSTNTQGVAATFARADHTHAVSLTRLHTEVAAGQTISVATFTDVTNATLTATDAGTYFVLYDGIYTTSNNSRTVTIIVNVAGSDVTATQRTQISAAAASDQIMETHTVVTVAANTIIKIRASVSSNTMTVGNQALTLIKLA